MSIPLHPLTSRYVAKKHTALAKRMVEDKKLDLHHQMSVELWEAKDLMKFNAILDKYDYDKEAT